MVLLTVGPQGGAHWIGLHSGLSEAAMPTTPSLNGWGFILEVCHVVRPEKEGHAIDHSVAESTKLRCSIAAALIIILIMTVIRGEKQVHGNDGRDRRRDGGGALWNSPRPGPRVQTH